MKQLRWLPRVGRILFFLWISFQVAPANALCVTTSGTNLRSDPKSTARVTWKVPKYTPLVEIKRNGNWIQVQDQDGELHWIYGTNVTSKIYCVSVRVGTARLRKSPGAQGTLADIRQVDKYTPFKRLDVNGEWAEVEAPWGETYWIHEANVWRPVRVANVNF